MCTEPNILYSMVQDEYITVPFHSATLIKLVTAPAEQENVASANVYRVFPVFSATVVKTEAGSLPEGKVKIRLEHDGTILDVDEDDVEKVSGSWLQMVNGGAAVGINLIHFYISVDISYHLLNLCGIICSVY